jgi:hypothetical protein
LEASFRKVYKNTTKEKFWLSLGIIMKLGLGGIVQSNQAEEYLL